MFTGAEMQLNSVINAVIPHKIEHEALFFLFVLEFRCALFYFKKLH